MKLIVVVFRDPNGNLQEQRLDSNKFKIHTEPGWLKIIGPEGPVSLIPSDKISLVQFVEEESKPKILRPEILQPPSKFQTS